MLIAYHKPALFKVPLVTTLTNLSSPSGDLRKRDRNKREEREGSESRGKIQMEERPTSWNGTW